MKLLEAVKNKVVDTYYFFDLIHQVFNRWREERLCSTCGKKTWPGKIKVAEVTLTNEKVVPVEILVRGCPSNCAYHVDSQTINLEGENLTIDEFLYRAQTLDKRKALWYFRDLFRQTRVNSLRN